MRKTIYSRWQTSGGISLMQRRRGAFAILLLPALSSGFAFAQNNACQTTQPVSILGSTPVAQATIIYDPNQGVCWLANANLAASAGMQASSNVTGINPNGSMDYPTALKWVAALNAYNYGSGYLDHRNWQLPVTALVDKTCADVGTYGGRLAPSALAALSGTFIQQVSGRLTQRASLPV
jgi:hypothetical protein